LQDLAGPKLRLGDFPDGQVALLAGQDFTLSASPRCGSETGVQVDFPEIVGEIPPGARVLWADGQMELRVESKSANALKCRVLAGGVLRSHAGVNFPSHSLSIPALTAKDREDLRFGVKMGVDYIGVSFVRSPPGRPGGPGRHPFPGRRPPHYRRNGKARGPGARRRILLVRQGCEFFHPDFSHLENRFPFSVFRFL